MVYRRRRGEAVTAAGVPAAATGAGTDATADRLADTVPGPATDAGPHAAPAAAAHAPAWRRAGATAVDYGLIGVWGAALAGVAAAAGIQADSAVSPGAGQLLGVATMTVPATVALAVAEARGASPGKRLLGIEVEAAAGGSPDLPTALVRSLAKVALPWELAHTGVWQLVQGEGGALAVGSTGAAYVMLGIAAVGVLRGRTWYDRLCGTRVVLRDTHTGKA